MAAIVKSRGGYEVGCRCGWRQNASTPELATTLRDGHLCEIDKLTAVVVIAREMAQADCACGECFACRIRTALGEQPNAMGDGETLASVGIDAEAAKARLFARVSEFEQMREERDAAVRNETETASLLAGAREHIEKLQGSIDYLMKQNERLEVEALRWHGEATKQERISEMHAKASIDGQEMLRLVEDDCDALASALRDLLAAFLHEAAQGDGVAEEHMVCVEAAKAALASLPKALNAPGLPSGGGVNLGDFVHHPNATTAEPTEAKGAGLARPGPNGGALSNCGLCGGSGLAEMPRTGNTYSCECGTRK